MLDRCHAQVLQALRNDGWIVDDVPVALSVEERTAIIDIRASRQLNGIQRQMLLAEVKCFAGKRATTTDVYTAIGQYLVYQGMLEKLRLLIPLYLAIPHIAFETIFDRVILDIIERNHIKVLLVDIEREVIVRWIE